MALTPRAEFYAHALCVHLYHCLQCRRPPEATAWLASCIPPASTLCQIALCRKVFCMPTLTTCRSASCNLHPNQFAHSSLCPKFHLCSMAQRHASVGCEQKHHHQHLPDLACAARMKGAHRNHCRCHPQRHCQARNRHRRSLHQRPESEDAQMNVALLSPFAAGNQDSSCRGCHTICEFVALMAGCTYEEEETLVSRKHR